MKLAQLKVTNFRCYKEETVLALDDLTVIIGKNDAGKSSLFDAMEIFFNTKKPEIDDLSVGVDTQKIRIACAFDEVPEENIIDTKYNTNLASEYLVNKNKYLEIVKEFDCNVQPIKEKVLLRAFHPTKESISDLHSLDNDGLKNKIDSLFGENYKVNRSINSKMRKAIWEKYNKKELDLQEVDLDLSEGHAKEIWRKLNKILPLFFLFKSDRISTDQDAEAKDPMKVIVKEVVKANEDALNEITKKIETDVERMAKETINKVVTMNPELKNQLEPKVAAEKWDNLFNINLANNMGIKVNKRGSGTRRLILLNFFRVKAEEESDDSGTGVIYAFEEPETSQHPDNQLRLIRAFEDIAMRADSQVLFSTHTPNLARKLSYNSLRFVSTRDNIKNDEPAIYHGREEETMNMIVNSLGVLPDHGVKVFFGVEGRNDIKFLKTISKKLRNSKNNIPDLEEAENSGKLIFIPIGGCGNLDLWVSRLNSLDVKEFYLLDGDNSKDGEHEKQSDIDELRNADNTDTVWITSKKELENYIHKDVIVNECPGYQGKNDPGEDVPKLLAEAQHMQGGSEIPWEEVIKDKTKISDKLSRAKKKLNGKIVEAMTVEQLTSIDKDGEVKMWLCEIGEALEA